MKKQSKEYINDEKGDLMKFTRLRKFSPIRINESIDGQIRSFKGFQKQSKNNPKNYKQYSKRFQKSAIFLH
jgi:hypothetical protein